MPSDPLGEQVAASLDAPFSLLPLFPELFADLEALGAFPDHVVRALGAVSLPARARVLDLGCGKGATSIALAQAFDVHVHGIDAFPPFVDHATGRAATLGLADRCTFSVGDVREVVHDARGHDVVCLLALGDVLGPLDTTIASLRECVGPGGVIVLDDAYLRDEGPTPDGVENCHDHRTTLAMLQSEGDHLLSETVVDGPDARPLYDAMTAALRGRVQTLTDRFPDRADELRAFLRRQEDEVELLSGPVVGALWLLRRS